MGTALLVLPPGSAGGNRTTALRWARILRRAGWKVVRDPSPNPRPVDLILALHARKTRERVRALRLEHPGAPLIVAATGTDLYVDLPGAGPDAQVALEGFEDADRIVVLQERALDALPAQLRARARVIHQSVPGTSATPASDPGCFQVLMLAGVRPVKDPLVVPAALKLLPAASRVMVDHLGPPMDAELSAQVRAAADTNPRYRWLGELPRLEVLTRLAQARLLVSPSLQEGGANVLTEAFALGVPVLATRVDGAVGLLGEDHPGLFPVGDAPALAQLLLRCEQEPEFLEQLGRRSQERAWMADPEREAAAWRDLLAELFARARP